ncbi:hypothetical protein [Noviherbaspirillum sp.]|uniref:hypothetical protein n=1 Tax=Noviherbaspirillum sp. TaxID=1926288 RepID=UPI002FE03C4D
MKRVEDDLEYELRTPLARMPGKVGLGGIEACMTLTAIRSGSGQMGLGGRK